jgi:hypothetical protein
MKITSGYKGFRNSVDAAFDATCHNPALKYSPKTGFYVESDLISTDSDDCNLGQVYYNLNDGGKRAPGRGRKSYLEIVSRIISHYEGEMASYEYRMAHSWAFGLEF